MAREDILADINDERVYQDDKWGTEFDDKNTVNDFAIYICRYASNAAFVEEAVKASAVAAQRNQLIKVAALAVAAIETIDRNGQLENRHYDSP